MIAYNNFRGDTYYLHSKTTKKGNISYHFSKKADGSVAMDKIPNGYEIYEEPNGKVYLRKQTKQLISDDEIKIIHDGMRAYSDINDYKLDVKKNIVYIYTVDNNFEGLPIGVPVDYMLKLRNYNTDLRFILTDPDNRTFEVERFCYKGSIDDWIFIDDSEDLITLIKTYVKHLGKESFYELM